MPSRPVSHGHQLSHSVAATSRGADDFTNVTEMSWPDAVVHPRYAGAHGYRELRAEIANDLAGLSIEALARISWVVGRCAR